MKAIEENGVTKYIADENDEVVQISEEQYVELYKQQIIKSAEKIAKDASEKIKINSIYHLANVAISRIEKYSTGRYDKKY